MAASSVTSTSERRRLSLESFGSALYDARSRHELALWIVSARPLRKKREIIKKKVCLQRLAGAFHVNPNARFRLHFKDSAPLTPVES
jgi:hypothetical protein